MKKTVLLAVIAAAFIGMPASNAAKKPSRSRAATTTAVAATSTYYKGFAYTNEVYGTLYFYGESAYSGVTLVKDANGNVVDASVQFNDIFGMTFVSIQIKNYDGNFFTPWMY